MNIYKKRIIKCTAVAFFMTFMFILIKMPDSKESQISSYENLNWKLYSLYFLGIFVIYYLIDLINKSNTLKNNK